MAARQWTLEQKQQQKEAIQGWKPWEQSTGPRTLEGKAKSARNAWKGGYWVALRKLEKQLNQLMRRQKGLIR